MLSARLSLLLCVSAWLAPPAWAQEAFVTQLRLPARGETLDVFAWRDSAGVSVERAALSKLGLAAPDGARVYLKDVPGLSYIELARDGAIVLDCSAACFETQRIGARAPAPMLSATPWGGYVNYDLAVEWRERGGETLGGVLEGNLFGPAGRGEMSWVADSEAGFTRLETRWIIDAPARRVRLSVGDGAASSLGGGMMRFGGVRIGRHFALAPREVIYPTLRLAGEAERASTIELYIDGALRAREHVAAGPFALEDAPFVSGAGEAHLIVTDVLGRQQMISRPFFGSTALLRPGLSDWSIAAGFEREGYGRESFAYGDGFFAARYRRGLDHAFTVEGGVEWREEGFAGEVGAAFADPAFGQVRLSMARSDEGGAVMGAWMRDARAWAFGVQAQARDAGFAALGQPRGESVSAAASLYLRLGEGGDVALTMAGASYAHGPEARTYSIAYTPDIGRVNLSFRLAYSERVRAELAFGVGLSMPLRRDVTGSASGQWDRDGGVYRASAQSAAPMAGGFGWRMRASGGAYERWDADLGYRGEVSELRARAGWSQAGAAARIEAAGAVGWIEQHAFAGRAIHGAFALVDAGAAGVGVSRDRLRLGRSGRDGRILAANLRAYDANIIAIDATDLPLDRAPRLLTQSVSPAEGAGVIVRFADTGQAIVETQARFADGAPAPRGAVLVRARDGVRFPVGGAGRVVLQGAAAGDVLRLDADARCAARADAEAARAGLVLECASAA